MAAILITGGAGYIGSHVAWAAIDAGREVVILDNLSSGLRACAPAAARFHEGDIGAPGVLEAVFARHDIAAVMHFAGSIVVPESVADPLGYYRNNTLNSHRLISQALASGVRRFIFSSTAAVYAPTRNPRVEEDDPTGPLSPYGWSKLMTEQMLADAAAAHDLRYCALRYFNVAGADPEGRTGQCTPNATHLIKVAAQTALGLRRELTIFGEDYDTADGTCVRDYIHVSDLATAHLAALSYLEAGGGSEVINIGYGRGASVREVLAAVERVSGQALPIRLGPRRPGDAPALVAENAKLKALLHWRPAHADLDAIVAAALTWEAKLDAGAHFG